MPGERNIGGGLVYEVNLGGFYIVQENTCCLYFTLKSIENLKLLC